jgi:hypothetical protein
MKKSNNYYMIVLVITLYLVSGLIPQSFAQIGIWTSSAELADIPMSGCAWDKVLAEADAVDPNQADVSNQDGQNNVGILACGIVYARNGVQTYKDKVITACEKLVQGGKPADRTLAWSRETGAYVMAADLVGYRTTAFEDWCLNMAEVYVASDGRTILEMFKARPNNWGGHGFGALCAIYAYLGNTTRLNEIRSHWILMVTGPKPAETTYGELWWQADEVNPVLINPQGAMKSGHNVDGIIPDDMRRGGSFKFPPGHTDYNWEHLQGTLSAARVLDRAGLSIYTVDNSALYRAAYALQVRLENAYGAWAAAGDDEWMMPYFDEAYSLNWADSYDPCTSRIYDHGKNAGWGYVTLGSGSQPDPPADPSSLVATAVSGCQIDLDWVDNADNESGFKVEQSTDGGQNFNEVAMVGPNVTSYSDDDLSVSTQYCYRVYAFNGGGNSGYSNTDCATTTSTPCPDEDTADSDIPVSGTVSGSYTNTQSSDNVYESIEEIESGGKPANRHSFLEHKWTINVTGGNVVTFYLEAYQSVSSDGDNFVFAYSTNDADYTDMVTVTKTSDDDTYQTYGLPGGLSGTVYIRVKDTDQTQGNRNLDIIYVDRMYILSEGEVTPPAAPTSLVATAISSSRIDLVWVDNADNEAGFKIEQSTDGGQNFSEIDQVGADVTNYSDTGLSPLTQYCYQVRAYNGGGNSAYSNSDCATTLEAGGPVDDVANSDIPVSGTVSGSYLDTQASDDVYESIEEIMLSHPQPKKQYNYLEHKWTINVTGGTGVTFYVEAYHTANSEGDDFVFAYSTDDASYTNMVTVTKTSDDNTPQTYVLPSSLSGTVYIQVVDTDHTKELTNLDVIYVDHMFIRSASAKQIAHDDYPVEGSLPTEITLYRNYPNPFNPSTTIRYDLTESGHVTLTVYDMMGRMVSTLVDCEQEAGVYTQVWEAVDTQGQQLSSGVYLYRLQVGSHVQTMKMIYTR